MGFHSALMYHVSIYVQGDDRQNLMRTARCQQLLVFCSRVTDPSDCVQTALGAYQLNTSVIVDAHSVMYPAVISEIMCFGSLKGLLAKLADKPLRALQRLMIAVDAAKVSSPSLTTCRECSAAAQDGFSTHGGRRCSRHLWSHRIDISFRTQLRSSSSRLTGQAFAICLARSEHISAIYTSHSLLVAAAMQAGKADWSEGIMRRAHTIRRGWPSCTEEASLIWPSTAPTCC